MGEQRDRRSSEGRLAFLGEHGDVRRDHEGRPGSRWLVAVSLLLAGEADAATVRAQIQMLRDELRDGRGLAEQRDPARWTELVERLSPLPFRIVALAVDQRRFGPTPAASGLSGPSGQVAKLLYRRLFHADPALRVCADTRESARFSSQLPVLLEREHARRHPPSAQGLLPFGSPVLGVEAAVPRLRLSVSAAEPLLRLADLLASAFGRGLEGGSDAAWLAPLLQRLREKGSVDVWPGVPFADARTEARPSGDEAVRVLARERIEGFLRAFEEHEDLDTERLRATLGVLIFPRLAGDANGWVHRGVIEDELRERGFDVGTGDFVRTSLVAPLRDRGVLIASSREGYCIPATVDDLRAWVTLVESVTGPMVRRLGKARDAVLSATGGEVDVLAGSKFAALRGALDEERG